MGVVPETILAPSLRKKLIRYSKSLEYFAEVSKALADCSFGSGW